MLNQKVEVIPFFFGRKLHVAVNVEGKEVCETEIEIGLLFKHFLEVIDPSAELEEAIELLCSIEEGIHSIEDFLG